MCFLEKPELNFGEHHLSWIGKVDLHTLKRFALLWHVVGLEMDWALIHVGKNLLCKDNI